VVVERGWWDVLVDPARYRMRGGVRLARILGQLLPRPDLVVILHAEPEVLLRRKAELSAEEMHRQLAAWESSLPRSVRRIRLDVSRPLEEVSEAARKEVVDLLESRAIGRAGSGWTYASIPALGPVFLPRGPRRAGKASLRVRHPSTELQLGAWLAARCFVSFYGLRLLPRRSVPPRQVREALAPYIPPRGTFAVAVSANKSCYHACIVDADGRCHALAKIAVDDPAARALDHEARAIRNLGKLLSAPVSAPSVLAYEQGVLLFEPIHWRRRWLVRRLPEEVARSLGAFFAAGSLDGMGPSHGNLSPGSLLRDESGWTLCDWSEASSSKPPFHDLVRFLTEADVLRIRLGRVQPWQQAPWVRRAFFAYADAANIPVSCVPELVQACVSHERST
jgi:hypothetical protein